MARGFGSVLLILLNNVEIWHQLNKSVVRYNIETVIKKIGK